jgi:hypothetical protein
MSIFTRIRRAGEIATIVGVAVGALTVVLVWGSIGLLPGILSFWSAGALMGVVGVTSLCVFLALGVDAAEQRLDSLDPSDASLGVPSEVEPL